MTHKHCTRCCALKPISEFRLRSFPYQHMRMPWCKDCKREYDRIAAANRYEAKRA